MGSLSLGEPMMTQGEFERTISAWEEVETMRGQLYARALRLIAQGFATEAHLLILATWNFARFRYVVPSFNLADYESRLQSIRANFQDLAPCDIATVDLKGHRKSIIDAFNSLAAVKGVERTGAAKALHLLLPGVFVMWDAAIAGWHSPKADYRTLKIVQSGFWKPPMNPFAKNGAGYHDFLVYCQSRFGGFVSPTKDKTLAKCIDEFNYCTITKALPIRKKMRASQGH
jgi:hypothetical protein